MKITIQIKIIGWFWLIMGGVITIQSITWLWDFIKSPYLTWNDIVATSIGLLFGLLVFIAASFLLKKRRLGRLLITMLSIIFLLYGAVFILFGGAEDVSIFYSVMVLFLVVVSIYSLGLLGKRSNSHFQELWALSLR